MRIAFLDLTDNGNYLYVFEKKQGSYELAQESEFSITGSPELNTLITGTDTAYLSLPLSMLNFRLMDLPFSDIEKIRDVLSFQLEGITMDRDVIGDVCLPRQSADTSDMEKNSRRLRYMYGKRCLESC